MIDGSWNEAEDYRRLSALRVSSRSGFEEDLRTTPLLSLLVKDAVEKGIDSVESNKKPFPAAKIHDQYAVLGFHTGHHPLIPEDEPILMNVSAPSSAFICGSQGSGKSYTLSCMLENCLIADKRIGRVHRPLAAVAFNYGSDLTGAVAETAYLCSMGIRINVLVSQSNEHPLSVAYKKIPGSERYLSVTPLLLHASDLSIERMHRLMAFADKESSIPLYMSVALRILRQMAIKARGGAFDYMTFKKALESENLTKEQQGPLNLRLELLESFLNLAQSGSKRPSKSVFDLEAGTLTIVDLTDPFMDPATACILFDICLSLFKERRPACGLVIALDEAHKYMTKSAASMNFNERLLGTIREQRHNATRVLIATQEPTISEKLLDLCSVSIIHRFTSPAWFSSLQNHLGAASKSRQCAMVQHTTFEQIMNLQVGESLVFAPSSSLCLDEEGVINRLGGASIKMRTRTRLGTDGGMSLLSSGNDDSLPERDHTENSWTGTGQDFAPEPDVHQESSSSGTHANHSQDLVTHNKQTIAIAPGKQEPKVEANGLSLDIARPHLVLICCSCQSIVIIEFQANSIPTLTKIDQTKPQAAMAYATCIKCLQQGPETTKKALKHYNFALGKEFYSGKMKVSDDLQSNLLTLLSQQLGQDITVLIRAILCT